MNFIQDPENMNTRQTHPRCKSTSPHPSPHAQHARGLALAAVLALLTLTPGCERRTHPGGASNPADRSSQTGAQIGTISADPNPVPPGPGKGKTTINWNVNEGTGQVYLAIDGGKEELFSGHTGAEATWIEEGHTYEFRLYAGEDHKTVLGTAKVTRGKQ